MPKICRTQSDADTCRRTLSTTSHVRNEVTRLNCEKSSDNRLTRRNQVNQQRVAWKHIIESRTLIKDDDTGDDDVHDHTSASIWGWQGTTTWWKTRQLTVSNKLRRYCRKRVFRNQRLSQHGNDEFLKQANKNKKPAPAGLQTPSRGLIDWRFIFACPS